MGFGGVGGGNWGGRVDAERFSGGVEDEGFHGGRKGWGSGFCGHGSFGDVMLESQPKLSE